MLSKWLLLGALPAAVLAGDTLSTHGFTPCLNNASIEINKMDVTFNRATKMVVFDVAGTSTKEQKVMASLAVSAYGKEVYSKSFNPCEEDTYVEQLCPVPAGTFSAQGDQAIPDQFSSMIPAIAFTIPDLDGQAKMELTPMDGGDDLACITSTLTNQKSMSVPAVPYVAAGIAGAALLMTGASALGASAGAAGGVGSVSPSPNFSEVMGWFQSMSMTAMMSVNYPSVYTSFAKNFGFSSGLIGWSNMQTAIDNFRKATGGNLTEANYEWLMSATIVQDSGSSKSKRGLEYANIFAREVTATVNGSTSTTGSASSNGTTSAKDEIMEYVHGVKGFAEKLSIPSTNTFMTVLLVFSIVIASITVGILLFKVILETWALFSTFPERLTNFRKRYWWILAKTITNLIMLLYGAWTLYCVYQFTHGDSWGALVLAAVTLTIFTGVLAFFAFRIWQIATKYKKLEGDTSALFEDKETWRKYSMFYENYQKGYWWLFVPTIAYAFAKGVVVAAGDGHGLAQTSAQLIIEALMLILLLWSRPYSLKSSNVINCTIQAVRFLSVLCVLVFVEELGISQTTQTVTGIVLVVIQSVLTGALAILIAVNSIITCIKENPHKKRRKEQEKLNRDLDDLTPLDARNSLLMDPIEYKGARGSIIQTKGYDPVPMKEGYGHHLRSNSKENLLTDAASMGSRDERSRSPPRERTPRLPDIEAGNGGYKGAAY
ncbi:uncharacterized protein K452DRAFT_304326 [Aplosporella prunicola CBS 121167]|uniref:ML-like domain-containing protein n=1 Tax=Aplosporella prunicola CBS 121167 TaxID=1176127 RepID=A0A6A6BTQ0_9PEZI|nr:uncharacterized protein K452DRAFT_304326 [Aplosporella prunicola CBS 121167]KAF2147509.1 hypothetical protein K452DRAFT_304326 [Aplosporella prunicola CBS 121167]